MFSKKLLHLKNIKKKKHVNNVLTVYMYVTVERYLSRLTKFNII